MSSEDSIWIDLLSRLVVLVDNVSFIALGLGVASFLVAVLIGAFRQLCTRLLSRTVTIRAADERGAEKTVHLGTTPPPIWFSLTFRIAVWGAVAGASLGSALIAGVFVSKAAGVGQAHPVFWGATIVVLAVRIALSAALARWSEVLRKARARRT